MSNKMVNNKKKTNNKKKNIPVKAKAKAVNSTKKKTGASSINNVFAMRSCAKEYGKSLFDPFSTHPTCLPIPPALPSMKIKAFARGVGQIGTDGFGGVLVSANLANDTTAGDAASAVSHSTAAATTSVLRIANTAGWEGVATNSPWTTAELSADGVRIRTSTMAVRLRYTGTELSRSGRKVALEQPDHATLTGASFAALQSYDKGTATPVDREWLTVRYKPVDPDELDYHSSTSGVGNTDHFMGIAITGVAGEEFEWEFVNNFEAIGTLARGKTESDSDRGVAETIINAFQKMSADDVNRIGRTAATAADGFRKIYTSYANAPASQRVLM